jgi:N-acetylgalactosamine kinase
MEPISVRREKCLSLFSSSFHATPDVFVRAPGRVNLIGEHVDYCGYCVLPMALDCDVMIAAKKIESARMHSGSGVIRLEIRNVDDSVHSPLDQSFDFSHGFPLDTSKSDAHHWTDYVICGMHGVFTEIGGSSWDDFETIQMTVYGTVPPGSGLSSSSALTCASVLALIHLCHPRGHDHDHSKGELADLACRSEQFIGLQSGGMDQAISFLAEEGVAMRIEFNPVRAFPVKLCTDKVDFVISHSMVVSRKKETAKTNYNRRVAECRLGAVLMWFDLFDGEFAHDHVTLADLQDRVMGYRGDGVDADGLHRMEKVVKKHLHTDGYALDEIAQHVGLDVCEVERRWIHVPVDTTTSLLFLHERCRHVYNETARVYQFEANSGNATVLGELMNKSHESLATLYDASCPELDRLTSLMRQYGAIGSRLTGAGWGGCAVTIVPRMATSSMLKSIAHEYYGGEDVQSLEKRGILFVSKPCAGASRMII